jgi:uncharacterized membrane protein YoaK (UPF0700 family)
MSLDSFSKSIETEGGKIIVIVFMLVFVIGMLMTLVLTKHPVQEGGKELATGAVSSLLTLLYQYLRPADKK